MLNNIFTNINNGILLNIYLTHGAHKSCITGTVMIDNKKYVRVSVNSKPIENKANLELINIISENFNISKSNVEIKRGSKSRYKQIYLKNYSISNIPKSIINIIK